VGSVDPRTSDDACLNHAVATFHHATEIMAADVAEQQDGFSDYGSDFEEEILKSLLQQAPLEPDNPITDADLQLKDIEDDRTPRGARVRTLRGEPHPVPISTKEKKSVTIQINGDSHIPTQGTLRDRVPDGTN